MHRLLVTAAALVALAGCRENLEPSANNAAANASAPAPGPEASVLGAPVSGEQAKTLMHDRHEGMEDIGDATKATGRTLESSAPDLGVVRASAAKIADLAPKAASWFPAGTGPDVGKTRAKAEIWQKPDDFAAKARAFASAAQSFNTAAQGDDLAAIKASYGEMMKTCKACHQPYRAPEDDHGKD